MPFHINIRELTSRTPEKNGTITVREHAGDSVRELLGRVSKYSI